MSTEYLCGRGIADITGEPADTGMLGYGKSRQRSDGIHLRLRSRAFVFADADGRRVLIVVNDLPMVFDSVCRALLDRLQASYGTLYNENNTMVTATHTHCGPGGYSHHRLYHSNTGGFRPKTFAAIVDGMTEAAARAHADLAPAVLTLSHGELRDASANRSKVAFDNNPPSDRRCFPDAVDAQTTLLRIERGGTPVGAINWFGVHNTSMTNRNTLISGDNKGYAAYHWERLVAGVDYRAHRAGDFVGAFAQTNAGDLTPNLDLRPGHGPTADEVENTRIIGLRQYEAAARLLTAPGSVLHGGIDHRLTHVDLSGVVVRPEFSGDGRDHRTGPPVGGASALAGSEEDGPAFRGFHEGRNPFWDRISRLIYRLRPGLRDVQAPKALVVGGLRGHYVARRAPVQLLRIGQLYLLGVPAEVTIVAGLRLRRTVASITGAELANVLVAGYSNGYLHYVTTPEEYDTQQYEGGSTLFGRWTLPALQQVASELASAMRDGVPVRYGDAEPDFSDRLRPARLRIPRDEAPAGLDFGDVLLEPRRTYRPGETVTAIFAAAYPNNDLQRNRTYLEIQRRAADDWLTVADDGDWSTTFRWRRTRFAQIAVVTWTVPQDAAGTYRIRCHGTAHRVLRPYSGTSRVFTIESEGGRHADQTATQRRPACHRQS
ncbi:neutral ceramidase [Kribbella sp. VKM Ac-2571]|uniref:neutral/alkaline non-lysosomal ceramidase N-terminal domain-containing protein n=1 Tax=Kribbella sp. VKM Ac-2571 TaxID=2512222 RepID=UPI00105B2210|nr:neutral/alkaline non-lysosomal ceramidase N-terminal domain-containing protein [Kribbella sp. VKM Ac-2571]TDO48315.1 neutral ceramidase [Kribbella sp. VKM Ac-2571]